MTTSDKNATTNGPTETTSSGTAATGAPAIETHAIETPTTSATDIGMATPDATHTEPGHTEVVSQTPRPMPIQVPVREEQASRNQHRRGPFARFLRSLFSHLLFAGIVVAGVLGYLYHAPMLRDLGDTVCADKALGQWMSTPPGTALVSRTSSASAPPLTPAPASQSAPASASAHSHAADQSTEPTPAPAAAKETVVVKSQPTADKLMPTPSSASTVTSPGTTTETLAPSPTQAEPAQTAPAQAIVPTSNAGATPPAPQAAAVPSDPRGQMLKEWASAREAFSKGRPEAESAYLALAKRFPDVPELTGELGNIYFQQGKMGDAANQYYETAQRLIRLGQPGPAACLIEVMRHLDADKARALEAQTSVPCPVQRAQPN